MPGNPEISPKKYAFFEYVHLLSIVCKEASAVSNVLGIDGKRNPNCKSPPEEEPQPATSNRHEDPTRCPCDSLLSMAAPPWRSGGGGALVKIKHSNV